MTAKPNVRLAALDILEKIYKQSAYSQFALNHYFENHPFTARDRSFITRLVYGTLQYQPTLSYYAESFLNNSKKIQPWVKWLLYLSFYQKVYMDRVPDHAIVNEAVYIARKKGHKGIAGLVNGVLRNLMRNGIPEIPEDREDLIYAHPDWLIRRFKQAYGDETATLICQANNQVAPLNIRVNLSLTTVDEAIERLEKEGVETRRSELYPEFALICENSQPAHTDSYRDGLVTIQDESSMLVADALDLQPDLKVLDACAGPGGKTSHIGESLDGSGEITALDIHEHKTRLIDQQAKRLRLENISTLALDAREAGKQFNQESFDRLLIDAPCTGFGVIRRKPEIKWTKSPDDIEKIAVIQKDILEETAPLVKPGGLLVYSTCTIDQEENRLQVEAFMENHPEFSFDQGLKNRLPAAVRDQGLWYNDGMLQLLPHMLDTDGFFIAALVKK